MTYAQVMWAWYQQLTQKEGKNITNLRVGPNTATRIMATSTIGDSIIFATLNSMKVKVYSDPSVPEGAMCLVGGGRMIRLVNLKVKP